MVIGQLLSAVIGYSLVVVIMNNNNLMTRQILNDDEDNDDGDDDDDDDDDDVQSPSNKVTYNPIIGYLITSNYY